MHLFLKVITLLFFVLITKAYANDVVHYQWIERGEGKFSRFGFHIYDAKFWSRDLSNNPPYMLAITYQRNIEFSKIIDASIKEMKRQIKDDSQLKKWENYLFNVIPSVKKGDVIKGIHNGKSATFYLNNKNLGSISDKLFANAFFGIWLSPKTSEPKLRQRLLAVP